MTGSLQLGVCFYGWVIDAVEFDLLFLDVSVLSEFVVTLTLKPFTRTD